jgi:hypothetical protein
MSGGRWGYLGAQLRHAALEIEAEIEDGGRSLAVTGKLAEAAVCLRRAAVYEERCDWLLSCDDGPEAFLHSLAKELREVGGDEWWKLYREVQRLRHELDMAQSLIVRYRAALYEINKQFRSDDVMSIEAALSAVEELLDNAWHTL